MRRTPPGRTGPAGRSAVRLSSNQPVRRVRASPCRRRTELQDGASIQRTRDMIVDGTRLRGPTTVSQAMILLGSAIVAGLVVPIAGPRLGLLVAGGVLTLVGLAVAPGVVFAFYLLIPFYKAGAQPFVPIDLTLILAALNVLQIVPVIVRPPRGRVSRVGVGLWVGLATLVLFGVLYAPDQRLALGHAATFWLLVFGALTAGALRVGSDRRYVAQLLWTFFGMGVVTTVLGLGSLSDTARLTVLGTNTINAALSALFVPLVGISFLLRQAPFWVRVVTVALIPAALIVALSTGS